LLAEFWGDLSPSGDERLCIDSWVAVGNVTVSYGFLHRACWSRRMHPCTTLKACSFFLQVRGSGTRPGGPAWHLRSERCRESTVDCCVALVSRFSSQERECPVPATAKRRCGPTAWRQMETAGCCEKCCNLLHEAVYMYAYVPWPAGRMKTWGIDRVRGRHASGI
jgi:hypothetical protein